MRPIQPVRFFGDAIPASFAETETPVLCRIRPTHVVALNATGPTRRDGEERKHMTGPIAPAPLPVPPSHLDLLTRPICGVFTTLGHDGQPQSTVVWVDLDSGCALVNTTLERQKGRNLLDNQKVSLLIVDPGNTWRPATSVDSDHTRITGHRRNPDGDEVPEVRRRL